LNPVTGIDDCTEREMSDGEHFNANFGNAFVEVFV
jgi:hypothetical protein